MKVSEKIFRTLKITSSPAGSEIQNAQDNWEMLVFHNYVSIFLILYRYLETEHIRHCVPSNVSSGLATLPLKYVWLDGKENKSWPTNRKLPTGEPLNGPQAYSKILSYFTTNTMTPMEVHRLGQQQLAVLYPMVSYVLSVWKICL